MMSKMLNFLYHFEPLYRFTSLYKLEQKHAHQGVLKIADDILEEKKEFQKKFFDENRSSFDDEDGLNRKPKSFINTLLDPKNAFSEQEIKDEINTLIAAVS
jgi:hypothetical protein